MKANDIALHQQKLLVAWIFCESYQKKVTNLHELHATYLDYCREKVNIRYAFGKFYFGGLIQKFGVRRCRRTGPSVWKMPENYNPNVLIDIIASETDRLVTEGPGNEANFGNFK